MCKNGKNLTNTCSFRPSEEILYKFSKSDYISFSFFVKKALKNSPEFEKFKKEYMEENPEYEDK